MRRIVGDGDFDADLLLPPTVSTSTRCGRCARAPTCARSRTSPAAASPGTSRGCCREGVGAVVDPAAWERPDVFGWLAEHGVAEDELRRVFNIGIGYCAVVPAADVRRGRPRDRPGRGGVDGVVVGRRVIGVLVSGRGSNLQALIDAGLPIVAVASNVEGAPRPDAGRGAGSPTAAFPLERLRRSRRARRRDGGLARGARRRARRLRRLHAPADASSSSSGSPGASSTCIRRCSPRSPAPTRSRTRSPPASTETGATVHLVDEGVDTGPVLRQEAVPVLPATRAETLHARIRAVEHRLLPEVVRELIAA